MKQKDKPVIGYHVTVDAYQLACKRLAQLPYNQVADVFQALNQGTTALFEEEPPPADPAGKKKPK